MPINTLTIVQPLMKAFGCFTLFMSSLLATLCQDSKHSDFKLVTLILYQTRLQLAVANKVDFSVWVPQGSDIAPIVSISISRPCKLQWIIGPLQVHMDVIATLNSSICVVPLVCFLAVATTDPSLYLCWPKIQNFSLNNRQKLNYQNQAFIYLPGQSCVSIAVNHQY